jgi:nucleotide-binding universal stress UspA family protein
MLLVFVEVVMRAPGPDTDPQWQLDERRRALSRLASVRDDANADAQLLTVQAGSVARGLHEAVRRHGDLLVIGAARSDEFERTFVGDDARQVCRTPLRRRRGAHRLRDAPAFARHDRRRVRRLARERAGADRGEHARPRAGAELSAFEAVADPMYVGSHEYRLRDRFSGGSTSQRLADSAACPLLVLGPEPGTRLERASGVRSRPRAGRSAALP